MAKRSNSSPKNQPDSNEGTGLRSKMPSWSRLTEWFITEDKSLTSLAVLLGLVISAISLLIAGVSAGLSAMKYKQASDQAKRLFDQFEYEEHLRVISNLEATENRYNGVREFSLPDGEASSGDHLQVFFKEDGERTKVYFRLPREVRLVTQQRFRTMRDQDGREQEQGFTVQFPQEFGPISMSVSPFGCVECNSLTRLADYQYAKKYRDSNQHGDRIRLARAALDFGEFSEAREHLTRSIELAGMDGVPEAVRAHAYADIGKTYYIMDEIEIGESLLIKAGDILKRNMRKGQLGEFHTLLEWRAQFAATQHDQVSMETLLAEFASVVDSYQLSEGYTSQMIHDAFARVIAIRSTYRDYDPMIPVPEEYKVFIHSMGGWVQPKAASISDSKEILPPFFRWSGSNWKAVARPLQTGAAA